MIEINIKLNKNISFSVFAAVLLCRGEELLLAYAAIFIHEAVHCLAAYACGVRAVGAEVDIFGIRLKTPYILSCTDRIIISSSGPLASLAIFLLFEAADNIFSFMGRWCAFFSFANFCIGIVNLMPISPLDGGGILKALLSRSFGIILGGKLFRVISVCFCTVYIIFAVLSSMIGVFNPCILLLAVFLLMGIRNESYVALNERKAVLSGDLSGKAPLKYAAHDGSCPLIRAVSGISADYILHTAVFFEGRFIGELSQCELILAIKKHGALTELKDCVEKIKSL